MARRDANPEAAATSRLRRLSAAAPADARGRISDSVGCADVARDTSFSYAFLMLPPAKRKAIVVVWDFCRAVDDAVDEAGPAGEWPLGPDARRRAERELGVWRDELARCFD